MKKPFFELNPTEIRMSSFTIHPIEGYEAPTNKETGEPFPNCCPFHSSVFRLATDWFEKFPNCCDPHIEMAGKQWFKKTDYNGVVEKIISQLSFSEYHISQVIEKEDWYKDITDYIEYNVWSFGQPAIGLHFYLNNRYLYTSWDKDFKNSKSSI